MAILKDAVDLSKAAIVINGVETAAITGVTLDGKSPEDLVAVIGGTVRRRKAETLDWSADEVMLYGNLIDLEAIKNGTKFNIELTFVNPDSTDTTNLGTKLIIRDCTVNAHSIAFSESSTFKMSGTASDYTIDGGYTG